MPTKTKLITKLKSKLITFEGGEGVGKSTNIKFIAEWLLAKGVDLVLTREPGGTKIGEELRRILLAHQEEIISPETETLLIFAARSQHINQIILPALRAGKCVLCDRFTDATYAYQGGGRGVSLTAIAAIEKLVQQELQPNLVLLLDIPVELGLKRAKNRSQADRIESEELSFFERVRAQYLARAQAMPQRYKILDTTKSLEAVQAELIDIFMKLISN